MNRDLVIGTVFALLLHSGVMWWGAGQVRPKPATIVREETVRTVREQIELPKPPPPPPKPEPEPEPQPAKDDTAPAPQRAPVIKSRAPQPASERKAENQPNNNEPQPLVLSQTYGEGSDSGVAVQSGKEDVLGDPGVEATERNTRRRSDDTPKAAQSADSAAREAEIKVEIVHAAPRTRCTVDWPAGAEIGNRVVEVTLSLQIGLDGTVTQARILRSAGQPFDQVAIAAMKACAFKPGTRDGKVFADRVPFIVEFKPSAH